MIRVTGSSFISGIDYIVGTSTLVIETFSQNKGAEFPKTQFLLYTGVPPCVFDAGKRVLSAGGSMGVFYNSEVKHYFSCVKLDQTAFANVAKAAGK